MANGREVVYPSGGSGSGGGAPTTATYILETANGSLPSAFALGSLATGILKSTTTTGVPSIATGSDLNTTFGSQTLNKVYASPNGSSGNPAFRALVPFDIPTLNLTFISDAGTIASQNSSNVSITGGSVTLKDNLFTLQATGDTTKQAQFVLSSIATATTRSYTLPDVSDTLVTLTATQVLTNKTLTAPTIGDFTNANHTHQSAAQGGSLDAAAIGSGTLLNARVNWAAPGTIGSTTANTGAFTTLSGLVLDAGTATVTDILTLEHDSSSTPAVSFGTGVRLKGHSGTNTARDMARWRTVWTTAIDSSRVAKAIFSVWNVAAETDVITINPSGAGFGSQSSPSWPVDVLFATTANAAFAARIRTDVTTGGGANNNAALQITSNWGSAATISAQFGITSTIGGAPAGAGIITTATGIQSLASPAANLTMTSAYLYSAQATGAGAITSSYGFRYVAATTTTITNEYGLYVENVTKGATLNYAIFTNKGDVSLGDSTIKFGIFGAAPVVQQASAANLTNNVTAGGTTDTIANYTDLATYANDAAAIRNDIYQLSRKLKQVNDALRLYGMLT